MPKIHFERFDNLLKFLPKSKIKAGDGQDSGKYPFFKSGNDQSKFIDTAIFEGESLIIGDGGNANINFYDKKFSASDHCYVIQKDSQDIDLKYVYYYLKSNLQILEAGFKGAGLKNISKKYISEIKIPLLALQDQQKIVQLLTQIEELIKKREKSIKLLDELIKSTFLDIFGDPGINRNNFPIKKFGEHIEYIGDIGSNGSNANISANLEMLDTEDYAIMIRTVNLNANDFKNNIKYVENFSMDKHIDKLINVYGDSFRAAEYPSSNVSSIFDNGSIKTKELTDEEIVNAIKNPGKKKEIVTDSLKDEENSLSLPTEEDSWKEEDNNDTCTPF